MKKYWMIIEQTGTTEIRELELQEEGYTIILLKDPVDKWIHTVTKRDMNRGIVFDGYGKAKRFLLKKIDDKIMKLRGEVERERAKWYEVRDDMMRRIIDRRKKR